MAKSCSTTFNVTVENPITLPVAAYWPLDEDYTGGGFDTAYWYDSVVGRRIKGPKEEYIAAGKLVHARRDLNWQLYGDELGGDAAGWPEMGYNTAVGDGFTIWGWYKKSTPVSVPTSIYMPRWFIETDAIGSDPLARLICWLRPVVGDLRIWLDTYSPVGAYQTDLIVISPPAWAAEFNAGDWVFLAVTWNASDKLLRVYQNDYPVVVGSNPVTMYDLASGYFAPGLASGTGRLYADEIGLSIQKCATAAQIAGLYNLGSGITWPDVQWPDQFP